MSNLCCKKQQVDGRFPGHTLKPKAHSRYNTTFVKFRFSPTSPSFSPLLFFYFPHLPSCLISFPHFPAILPLMPVFVSPYLLSWAFLSLFLFFSSFPLFPLFSSYRLSWFLLSSLFFGSFPLISLFPPLSPILVFSPHVWAVSSSSVLSSPLLLTSPSFFLSPDSLLCLHLLSLSSLPSFSCILFCPPPTPLHSLLASLCLLSFPRFPLSATLPVFLFCLLTSTSYPLSSHPATKAQRSVIEEHLQAQGSRHNTPNSPCWGRGPESVRINNWQH